MRFRIEPTFNVSEDIRLKAQIDVLDNVVLGSTPDGPYGDLAAGAPLGSNIQPLTICRTRRARPPPRATSTRTALPPSASGPR